MLSLRPSGERGHAHHGWLDTWHTFSFNTYYDPRFMGFRGLRVINEDVIAAGAGFGEHSHRDMEIVTYVLEGGLAHRDSIGSGGVIRPGEIQHMSAGSGIRHSEYNASQAAPVHLLQIWVEPEKHGIAPTYSQQSFAIDAQPDRLHRIASPGGEDGSLAWNADAALFAARLHPGGSVQHSFTQRRYGWVQAARGALRVNGREVVQGDGVSLSEEDTVALVAGPDGAEILLFELA
jgi:hypothetical protein